MKLCTSCKTEFEEEFHYAICARCLEDVCADCVKEEAIEAGGHETLCVECWNKRG